MKMFLDGGWEGGEQVLEVRQPYDQAILDTVPAASPEQVERAIEGAVRGAGIMREMPGYERFEILRRAADVMLQRQDELGRLISQEEGKVLAEGRFEVQRSAITMELAAEEAKRLGGEVLPLDGAPGAGKRLGFTLRIPCGVVAAITPFNFPLNLVCHKVGPALAAGNAVIIKPASDTPLSALKLVEILLQAGLPPQAIACLTGRGGDVGNALAADKRIRKVSFTGSGEVGEKICRVAGVKRVTMELGSNSPLIVLDDADLEKVTRATVATGFANAGQVCISTQRVIAVGGAYPDLLDRLRPAVESITTGDPLSGAHMGSMIRESDAKRVESWVGEAVSQGARLLCGGERNGTMMSPTLLADVQPQMKVACDEVFGPTVAVQSAGSVDEAIALANDSRYGLSAGVFTQNIDHALRFAREVDSGNIQINWGPQWRVDLMPYGGLKESGMGKEGPRYAIEEMTEMKTVVVHVD